MSQSNPAVKLWRFHGGVHPPERKSLANATPIRMLPLPKVLYIPLRQHLGASGSICVPPGTRVLRGQPLTEPGVYGGLPVHAPTSGIVGEVIEHPSNHPSQLPEPVLALEPDGEHEAIAMAGLADPMAMSPLALIEHLHDAGIAGLGGAGFPTAQKLSLARHIELLIINGVECEPYIVSDDRLMREHASEIVRGVRLLQYILTKQGKAPEAIIAVEDNKPEAIAALASAIDETDNIRVQVIPTLYPSGGEKQLIQILTGKEVPARGYPADIGILMQNVGTAFAIANAIDHGWPVMERVVTLTGQAFQQPGTAWVLLGTPIQHLLECAELEPGKNQRIIVGGPMMGYTVADPRTPIIKTTNCILAPTHKELPAAQQESPCIRCGMCEQVCPANLLPQQLQWLAKAKDHDGLAQHNLSDCIECGACAYVCPSEIPLVHYYRQAKADIREERIEQQKSEIARQRYEARQERLEREKQERLERHKKAAEARAKMLAEREKQAPQAGSTTEATASDEQDPIKAALARAKAKRAAQQAADNASAAQQDPQKAKVAAAVARAKAKRAAQQAEEKAPTDTDADAAKKAKIAAAVARAKAKRAAQQAEQASKNESAGDNNES